MFKKSIIGIAVCSSTLINASIDDNYRSELIKKYVYAIDIPAVNIDYLKIQKHYDIYDGPLSYDFLAYIDSVIEEEGMKGKVSLAFMIALIDTESQFIHDRISSTGAYGLCQIMPLTAKSINDMFGRQLDRMDEYDNVRLSVLYFKDLYERYKDTEAVVRFYNGGVKWRNKPATKRYYNSIMKKTTAIKDALKS